MLERLRYVTRRVDRSGRERWYWQRRGHPLTRLPDEKAERMAMAERLNAAADGRGSADHERGTIGWVIARYRGGDEYRDLAPGNSPGRISELPGGAQREALPTAEFLFQLQVGRDQHRPVLWEWA